MKIKDVDTENMTNDEINSLIKKLYQSKAQDLGGGGARSHTKVSIQVLSSADDAFDKKGKYYEWLKIPFFNNITYGDLKILFQENNTNFTKAMQWYRATSNDYDYLINYGYYSYGSLNNVNKSFIKEGGGGGQAMINIFIMNYNEQ